MFDQLFGCRVGWLAVQFRRPLPHTHTHTRPHSQAHTRRLQEVANQLINTAATSNELLQHIHTHTHTLSHADSAGHSHASSLPPFQTQELASQLINTAAMSNRLVQHVAWTEGKMPARKSSGPGTTGATPSSGTSAAGVWVAVCAAVCVCVCAFCVCNVYVCSSECVRFPTPTCLLLKEGRAHAAVGGALIGVAALQSRYSVNNAPSQTGSLQPSST